MLPIKEARQLRLQAAVRETEDAAINNITDTPGSSSSHWHQAAAQGRCASAAEAATGNRSITLPQTSTLLLSASGQADVMAQMFIASMAQQKWLTKLLLGKLYVYINIMESLYHLMGISGNTMTSTVVHTFM